MIPIPFEVALQRHCDAVDDDGESNIWLMMIMTLIPCDVAFLPQCDADDYDGGGNNDGESER